MKLLWVLLGQLWEIFGQLFVPLLLGAITDLHDLS